MADLIRIELKRVAVTLADTLDYSKAAARLDIPESELWAKIETLENTLCVRLFEPGQAGLMLTREGQVLIGGFREALSSHERKVLGEDISS